jgi:hypothetical protein
MSMFQKGRPAVLMCRPVEVIRQDVLVIQVLLAGRVHLKNCGEVGSKDPRSINQILSSMARANIITYIFIDA